MAGNFRILWFFFWGGGGEGGIFARGFRLGILEFPTMSSPSLIGGSLYGILDGILEFPSAEILRSSWGMTQNSWGMTENLEFLKDCFSSLAMTQGILNFA